MSSCSFYHVQRKDSRFIKQAEPQHLSRIIVSGWFGTADVRWLIQSNTDLEISENLKVLVLLSVTSGGPHPQYSLKEVSMVLAFLYFVHTSLIHFVALKINTLFFPHAFMLGTGKKLKIKKRIEDDVQKQAGF